jgi:hypothetical protein
VNAAEVPSLAIAVNRWLSYQLLCGREALLSEAYLGHPIAEYLIHKHSGEFATEIDHPVLNAPGPGRPRQIDYVLHTKNAGVIESAIECKWVSERPYDKQRIVNDILRLECVRVPGRHVKRYFIVAGLKKHFDPNFKDLNVNTGGARAPFTKEYLSFSKRNPDAKVKARACRDRFQSFYKDFERGFNAEVPISFETKCLSYRTADEISVCVWQISSVKNRQTFSPATQWP